jgi:multidrug efflux pump subunit AcrA (membrane-fusion protein)
VTGQETSLARLATREIELELAAARARAANDLRDAAVARSAAQPAQEQISLLSARRAEAQVALLEHRLRLADIRAPADGVIIAGDLRRSLGQPVSRGQVLFEIALPGPLRAEVLVLDEDIPAIREGQAVRFATAAEPGQPREALVERIRPMAEVVEGRNVFRVIARIGEGEDVALRPGMEGWARIETGRTTWLAAMLRDPVRWVRRLFWM